MKSTHCCGRLVSDCTTVVTFVLGKPEAGEDLLHLASLFVGNLFYLAHFALAFAFVVLGIAARGQVSAEAHGDRAGSDFRQSGDHHDMAVIDRAGEAGGQRKRNREPVGHSDDHVADDFSCGEVPLNVGRLRHLGPTPDGT